MTIERDDWGIAHIHGHSDADAVFGMLVAQAEDDFPRIKANYLTALGRISEAEGEKALWTDLRARLYVSEVKLKADYRRSPSAMQLLMTAWADGLNFFLATHRAVKPKVLTRFEPWMALSFTEGSIGGDIERIAPEGLASFYGHQKLALAALSDREPRGSNGIAIAPRLTVNGHTLLLINPHTDFYFRSEAQVSSDEGLNAYGASTWGQFFLYQGFNVDAGWMHTSSGVDNVDEFAYEVRPQGKGWAYRFGKAWRPLAEQQVAIRVWQPDGTLASRSFTTYATHRGPIIRAQDGRWIGFAMMDRPVNALQQSFGRTKTHEKRHWLSVDIAGVASSILATPTIFPSARAHDPGRRGRLSKVMKVPLLHACAGTDCPNVCADDGVFRKIAGRPDASAWCRAHGCGCASWSASGTRGLMRDSGIAIFLVRQGQS